MIPTLDAVPTTEDLTVADPAAPAVRRRRRPPSAPALLGLLATVLAVAFPFLPVEQGTAELTWPTAKSGTAPVSAPLVALRPLQLTADVGCAALRDLDARSAAPAVVLSTTPPTSPNGPGVGLVATVADGRLTVDDRGTRLVQAAIPTPPGPGCALSLRSTATRTQVTLAGSTLFTAGGDERPQVTGVYSDLDGTRDDLTGTAVRIGVDDRFDSSASVLKTLAGAGAVLALLGCLRALRRADHAHGRRPLRRLRPRFTLRDLAVGAALLAWTAVGSTTTDDGYILTMIRAAKSSGWMGNYYRWFDVPEAPFGWFYEAYARWAAAGESVLWLRVPALAMGIACWWLISRRLLPRLGVGVRLHRSAGWAAATLFLCFWLPFGNGLRPEPVVVLGTLLAACAVEQGIASRRLVPFALGLTAAAFTVAATPTGLLAVAPFLAGARPIVGVLRRRAAVAGWAATLAPAAAAGTVVLVAAYADQTWATVAEATRVRTAIGPNMPWSQELYRYMLLFSTGPDGSLARRFAVLMLVACTVIAMAVLLRRIRIPGVATGPARRLIGTAVLGFGVLALTPTKWTHHFGAFAGVGAGMAAVVAAATGAAVLRSRRNRLLVSAVFLGVAALACTGPNSWWYVSNWGVPWFDRAPVVGGVGMWMVLLTGAAVLAGLATIEHLRGRPPQRVRVPAGIPLALLCGAVVLVEIVSLAKGAAKQSGSYSLAADALTDPAGTGCGLSDRIEVETDPAAGALAAVPGPPAVPAGFTAGGLPPTGPGSPHDVDGAGNADPAASAPGPAVGPALGSYGTGEGATGDLQTSWYRMPGAPALAAAPLVVGVAGQVGDGTSVALEFGRTTAAGVQVVDRLDASAGAAITATTDPEGTSATGRGWRDLRFDLTGRPVAASADVVRVVAADRALAPEGWVAVTPPRVPKLTPLRDVVNGAPGFLDWPVAFPHPCLRPFGIRSGVAEMPAFRLLADPQQRGVGEEWSATSAGGPLAWISVAARQRTVPTYLEGEWSRDWGQLRLIEPYAPAARGPDLRRGRALVWGWSNPGPLGDPPPGPAAGSR